MPLAIVLRRPDQLVIHQPDLITQCRRHTLHGQLAGVFGQFRAVHQHAYLGVPQHRPGVEVERADEGLAPVEDDCLAVQARVRTAVEAHAPGTGVTRLAAQLEQLHTMFQKRPAIGCIAAMHRRHIGGFQRVGQQLHRGACVGTARQVQQPGLTRHEVGRNQYQLAVNGGQVRCQLLAHQQLRIRLVVCQHLAG
ncbi:hypothetical protein D3C76_1286440 [compost metagenome]